VTRIELNENEAQALREVLELDLSDLRMEIADTDRKDFRDMLKERKALLMNVLQHLGEASA
jgi:hypothetical protein